MRQAERPPAGATMRRIPAVAWLPPLLVAIPWIQELIDQLVFGGQWNLPMWRGGPFIGLFTAPFSHAGFGHLIANTVWFLPLSWLVLLKSRRDYLAVWIGVYAAALPVWLFWPGGSHGLSGVNYGLLGYLLSIGWLEKRATSLLLSVVCLLAYGGLLPALLPFLSPAGVSWIGHASGFLGGVLAAFAIHREPARNQADLDRP
jgi:membrane associated rhomboid family serine protease